MPSGRRLKVFRTAIGFHDAYVAAPSRKAALDAWGSDRDLFRMGAAEEVTDKALIRAALARPGEVIKRERGSTAEHVAALPKRKSPAAAAVPTEARKKPPPRPSRAGLDKAQAALDAAEEQRRKQLDRLTKEEAALARKRRQLVADWDKKMVELERARDTKRSELATAMERWRRTDER